MVEGKQSIRGICASKTQAILQKQIWKRVVSQSLFRVLLNQSSTGFVKKYLEKFGKQTTEEKRDVGPENGKTIGGDQANIEKVPEKEYGGESCNPEDFTTASLETGCIISRIPIHGQGMCMKVIEDSRTVVIGCSDAHGMIFSLTLNLSDPPKQLINNLGSRTRQQEASTSELPLVADIKQAYNSWSQHRTISAKFRENKLEGSQGPTSGNKLRANAKMANQYSDWYSQACLIQ